MSTVIRSALTEYDLGRAGWRLLHKIARQRGRKDFEQVRAFVLYGIDRELAGDNTELSSPALRALLEDGNALEPVA